ncbi:TPM domain-containing protein [Sphingobacterium hungaricum]|nr:TPM domain-containing protein [Sphingobacterium hungaricum]
MGYVNDFASILDSTETNLLENKLRAYDEKTSNQIAIISINSDKLTEDNFDQFSIDLSNYWGVGTAEKNNGIAICLSPGLRMIRINTGIGTKHILTDEICQQVLDSIIMPEFREGNYYKGINRAVDEFIRLWR